MDPFSILDTHFWLVALVVNLINWFALRARVVKAITDDPKEKSRYLSLIRILLFALSTPWIVMGVGTVFGKVPSVWQFLAPRDGGLYVLSFHLTVILLWIVGLIWIFHFKGAETIAESPLARGGQLLFPNSPESRAQFIKILWLIITAAGIIAEIGMWTWDFPASQFDHPAPLSPQ